MHQYIRVLLANVQYVAECHRRKTHQDEKSTDAASYKIASARCKLIEQYEGEIIK